MLFLKYLGCLILAPVIKRAKLGFNLHKGGSCMSVCWAFQSTFEFEDDCTDEDEKCAS
jgi:hypothetical protein